MAKKKKGLARFFDKAKEAVGKVLKAPAQAAQFVATIPFRPMMISILKKRGITPNDKQSELVQQFFKNIIAKQSFESGKEYFFVEEFDSRPKMISILKKRGITPKKKHSELVQQFKEEFESSEEYFVADIVSIVKAVITFFKDKKDRLEAKEAAGEKLTQGEQNTLDHTRAIEQAAGTAIRQEVTERVQQKAGKIALNPIVLIGVAAVAFVALRKN